MSRLNEWGWHPFFSNYMTDAGDLEPARVIVEHKDLYRVVTEIDETFAEISGRMTAESTDRPVVGDWVSIQRPAGSDRAIIHGLLPRRTALTRPRIDSNRKHSGSASEQVLAANVDVAFIVHALDVEFNPRRVRRYMALAWNGGVRPILLLTKADLSEDPVRIAAEFEFAQPGIEAIVVSVPDNLNLDRIQTYLPHDRTAVMLGPSGAGKSTLINRLIGDPAQAVGEVRESDRKGRHTTTSRQLFRLPQGGLLIDTPGLRSVGLMEAEAGLSMVFPDIEELGLGCRFGDCTHEHEPGCAVIEAVKEGLLDSARWRNYLDLRREAASLSRRNDPQARKKEGRKMGRMIAEVKKMPKQKFRSDS